MAVVYQTGEVMFCREVDIFANYVMADMTFIPVEEIYDIMDLEKPT